MNAIPRVVIVVLVLGILLVPFFLVLVTLFPKRVAKTQRLIDLLPARSFGIGLVNMLFFCAIALALFALSGRVEGPLKAVLAVPALLICAALLVALSFGLAGAVSLIGERLAAEQSTWRRTLWGTLLLCGACSVPFVGWFLLCTYVGCAGLGAFIFGLFQREEPALTEAAPE